MKLRMTLLVMILSLSLGAQTFKQISSVSIPFSPSKFEYAHTDDFRFFLCSTNSEMAMIDGVQGKVLWTLSFLKEFQIKKMSNQYWNRSANVILIYDDDSKKSVAPKFFIDGKTGKMLWKSEEYVDEFGKYELSDGFTNYYDEATNCVLLPTKESVDFVNVFTGKLRWTKSFTLEGRAKHFDCYIMEYYNLVKIQTGEETSMYLTTDGGDEVDDTEAYYNKKKALAQGYRATYLEIPELNQYVIMKGKDSKLLGFLGAITGVGGSYQSMEMTFSCYEEGTDRIIWQKKHNMPQAYDWITNEPYIRMFYEKGKLFVEHEPMVFDKSGLTVINMETGEMDWECLYSTTEMKGLMTVELTPFPAPDPVPYNNKVYVVDKVNNRVVCYDFYKGSKIWQSDKFPDAQKIPDLTVTDGMVIMTYGAPAKKIQKSEGKADYCFQYSTPTKRVVCGGGKQYTYKYIFNNKDKYGIIAYDAETGKIIWSSKTIAKKAKDKFAYIASTMFINGKLYCSTDKNFFILNPKDGSVLASLPISKEKMGATWGMQYFPKEDVIALNCKKGVIKIDAKEAKILGSVSIPTIPAALASDLMGADSNYADYALYTKGNPKKMKYKTWASIDLDKMVVRGVEEAWLLEANDNHFSEGAEMFFKAKGKSISVYSVK